MPSPLIAAALLTAMLLAAAPAHSGEAPPAASDADGVSAFLLRADGGARRFAAETADAEALDAAARSWAAKSDARRVAALASVSRPGSNGETRLVAALTKWTGAGRIAAAREKEAAVAFLEDAAAKASALLADPRVREEVDAAVAAADPTGAPGPGSRAAIERARALRERGTRSGAGVFGPDRNPGAIGDTSAGARSQGGSARALSGGVNPGAAGGVTGQASGTGAGGEANPVGTSAASFRPPVPERLRKASVVPPLSTADLTTSDRVINNVLSVANMESFSRKDTLNRESAEGTQSTICKFLIKAKYDPDEAWGLALAARNAPGADPGDLDLRNAEHYLYAYSTTAKPNGWGDSTPVQLLMAVGWTPFKTVTKHVRPTSKPSLEEAKWGVKGAWHGQHPPDWRATCQGARS
ncbi:MAG: hypothetical protein HYX59_16115 [Elusimicrobia bacterium]|nr:hypothetical protein [Elusimicrobiota bacterium]